MTSDQQPLHKKGGGPKAAPLQPEPLPEKKKCSGYHAYKTCSIVYAVLFVLIGLLLTGIAVWILIIKQDFQSINDVVHYPLILLLIAGIIIILTALIGCIGASCDKLWPLRIFLGIIILVFILQVVIGILAYVYREETVVKFADKIKFTIVEYDSNNDVRKAVDKVQNYWECCGIKGPDDWTANTNLMCIQGRNTPYHCEVPDSCCKTDNVACSRTGPGRSNLNLEGCRVQFQGWVERKLDCIGAIALAMAIIHILGMFVVYMFITKVEDRIRLFKYRKRFYS